MAVPKKKTSPGKKRQRSASKFLSVPKYLKDSNGNPILPHRIDSNGEYKGRKVIIKRVKVKSEESEAQ